MMDEVALLPWETPDGQKIRSAFTLKGPFTVEVKPGGECLESEWPNTHAARRICDARYIHWWDQLREMDYVTAWIDGRPVTTGRIPRSLISTVTDPALPASPAHILFISEWQPETSPEGAQLVQVWVEIEGSTALRRLAGVPNQFSDRYGLRVQSGPNGGLFLRVGETWAPGPEPKKVDAFVAGVDFEQARQAFLNTLSMGLESRVARMLFGAISARTEAFLTTIPGIRGEVAGAQDPVRIRQGIQVWHDRDPALENGLKRIKRKQEWGCWVQLVQGEWAKSPQHHGDTTYMVSQSADGEHWALRHQEAKRKIVLVARVADSSLPDSAVCTEMVARYVEAGGADVQLLDYAHPELFDTDTYFQPRSG